MLSDMLRATYFGCISLNLSFFDVSLFSSNRISVYTIFPEEPIEVFVHDADEPYPFFQRNSISINSKQSTEISIELKKYKRLDAPFASNCTKSSEPMIFPGNYSKPKCIQSLRCINTFKTCGFSDVFCQENIPTPYKKIYAKQFSTEEEENNLTDCVIAEYGKHYDDQCGVPCNEKVYSVMTSFNSDCSWLNVNQREIIIKYPINPYYHSIVEVQLYSVEQLLSDCGGLFGLFIGSSVISFMEVLAFLSLLLFGKIFKK